jgi:hypothetical protein
MEEKLKQDVERLKILNDIYINENEKIKLECILLQYEYQTLLNQHHAMLYEYETLLKRLNKNLAVRIYRKIKRVLKKILRRK